MGAFKYGIFTDNLEKPFIESLDIAAQMEITGIQFFTTKGELAPENLSPAARRQLLAEVKARGLEIASLCGDLHSAKQLADPAQNAPLIEKTGQILALAAEWGVDIVTTHLGPIPADTQATLYRVLLDACGRMAAHAERCGVWLAVETGTETAETLRGFLDAVGSSRMAVNLDPANLVMLVGDDAVRAVHTLAPYIVHTHAKDGRMVPGGYDELPLGRGNVPYPAYLAALKEIGYTGYIVVERESGDARAEDMRQALALLKGWE